jgi:hypothetical protein
MNPISDERISSFHVGQVWESPRGTVYIEPSGTKPSKNPQGTHTDEGVG